MNAHSYTTHLAVAAFIAIFACCVPTIAAESAQAKASAEALFQRGTELAARGNLAQACEKFEASQQLDPAPGTMLRLADCYDRLGKTASAWAWFHQVLSLARGERNERALVAAERVRDLESRLARIDIQVPVEARLEGLEVRLNGTTIPASSWGVPLPVDPGLQQLEFSAPGHQKQLDNVVVPNGPTTRAVVAPTLAATAPKASPSASAAATRSISLPARSDGSSPDALAVSPPPHKLELERPIGYALGGLGLVSVGLGIFFADRAYDMNQRSLDQCSSRDANACTPAGKSARDDALSFATASTVTVVLGTAMIGGGAVLLLWASHNDAHQPPNPGSSGRLRFASARNEASLAFEGQW